MQGDNTDRINIELDRMEASANTPQSDCVSYHSGVGAEVKEFVAREEVEDDNAGDPSNQDKRPIEPVVNSPQEVPW